MPGRELPPELLRVLRVAVRLEQAAADSKQWHEMIRANSRLMLAAVNAGWQVSEVAAVMGLERHAASKRVQSARRALAGVSNETPGIYISAPLPRRVTPSPLAILYTPVEGRDWLSAPEAMQLAGISFGTLTVWRRRGLLPNTRWLNRAQALYSRDDLNRVMAAPRTGRGVRYETVRQSIAASEG